jgi:hypothetical protein
LPVVRRGARRVRCGKGGRARMFGMCPSRRRASWSRAGEYSLQRYRNSGEVEELLAKLASQPSEMMPFDRDFALLEHRPASERSAQG